MNAGPSRSRWFGRLPGFQRTPAGWEWAVWRRLPAIGLWGTLGPAALSALAHLFSPDGADAAQARALQLFDYVLIGVVVLHWTLWLTLAIACAIVLLMKGPAFVADAYPMDERDGP